MLLLAPLAPLAFAADAPPDSDIWLADLDLAHGRVTGAHAVTTRPGYDNQPAFLPDGSALLYVADVDGPTDVFRYTLATGATTRVTTTLEAEFSPTPLADGSGFTVIRVGAPAAGVEPYTESQQLWRYDYSGKAVASVLPAVHRVGYHGWVDAGHVALVIVGPGGEAPNALVLADTTKGTVTPLAPDAGRSLAASGGRVLFVDKHDAKRWVVASVGAGDAAPTEIVVTPPNAPGEADDARSEDFRLLPDGSLLMAHGRRLLRWKAGGTWEVLAELPEVAGAIKRLAVSPDGTHLAFVVQR
jgi:hypothetical protein